MFFLATLVALDFSFVSEWVSGQSCELAYSELVDWQWHQHNVIDCLLTQHWQTILTPAVSEKKDRTCFHERPFICLDLFCTFPEPTLATCVVHAYDVHVWFINWDYYCDRLLTLPMHTPRSVITHQMRALDSGELPANIQFSFTLTYFASFIYSSLQQFHVENEEVRFWRDFYFRA